MNRPDTTNPASSTRRRLCGPLIAALAVVLCHATDLPAQCTIDFDDQPDGAMITTQYVADCGVHFAGTAGDPPPQVYDYGAQDIGRILHSHDWYAPIRVRFVQPHNYLIDRPVTYIEFDSPTGDNDLLEVRIFDANGTEIASYSSTVGSPETVVFDLGGPVAASMLIDDRNGTAFTVDNLTAAIEPPIFRGRFESGDTSRWSATVN